jgi:iron complex transport system substrate-binding protein
MFLASVDTFTRPAYTFADNWNGLGVGKAVKIGHGPATVIGSLVKAAKRMPKVRTPAGPLMRVLFARKGAASASLSLARLFCFGSAMNRLRQIALAAAAIVFALAWPHPAFAASRTVVDEVGRRVEIPEEVRRIVTLAPDLTETIYALGIEDRLVGDTNYCDTPEAAKLKPHIGDPKNPSLETIAALRPDLVLATTSINRIETADALARVGIPVYTADPQTVRGMLQSVSDIADVTGAEAQGKELTSQLQARLDAMHTKLADRPMVHVLFVVWESPLITIGQTTFIADALRWAGAESIVTSARPWPQISLEEVVRLQPEYIIYANSHGGLRSEELDDLRSRPVWKTLEAVQLGRVIDVNEEAIRPSPGLVGAMEQLARQIHPEVFPASSEQPANDSLQARCLACAR